jgi:hypothetical protein
MLFQRLLGNQGMGFAMTQISGRRTDQLRDIVTMLGLRAVDADVLIEEYFVVRLRLGAHGRIQAGFRPVRRL